MVLRRVIIHWTAGSHKASQSDKEHYHYIVEGTGAVVAGNLPPEANGDTASQYVPHTRNLNTGSIGVAVAAMLGAQERPFSAGAYPITDKQLEALARLVWTLCEKYKIPITRTTVLTHAEVQPTLGVAQSGKWDITWLPGMAWPADPVTAGDMLRKMIAEAKEPVRPDMETIHHDEPPAQGKWAAFIALIMQIFDKIRKSL